MNLPTLRTNRLVLEPFRREDIDELHALWADADVRRYLWDDEIISRERAVETVEAALRAADANGVGMWTVRESAQPSELIGFCGLRGVSEVDVELLYGLSPRYWRRGFATEAASVVLQYAFCELRLARVVAAADPDNRRSFGVLERLGMTPLPGGLPGSDLDFCAVVAVRGQLPLSCGEANRAKIKI